MMFGLHMCIAGTLSPHILLIISVPVKKECLAILLDIGTPSTITNTIFHSQIIDTFLVFLTW